MIIARLAFALLLMQAVTQAQQAAVRGTVLEEGSGKPISSARVRLTSLRPQQMASSGSLESITDANGRFAFAGLEPSSYVIQVSKGGFITAASNAPVSTFSLAPGETRDGLRLTLERGGAIEGRVVDSTGEPFPEGVVSLVRATVNGQTAVLMPFPLQTPAVTNDLGAFRLFGLPAGEYYVQVSPRAMGPPSIAPQTSMLAPTYYPSAASAQGAKPVVVAAGRTTGGINMSVLTLPVFRISGRVVDEAGSPIAGATISLTPEPPRPQVPYTALPRVRTGQNGEFSVTNVFGGNYTVNAGVPVAVRPATSGPPSPPPATGVGGAEVRVGGGISSAVVGGVVGGLVSSPGTTSWETSNGMTTEYRTDQRSAVPVTVGSANVSDVRITVRRPEPR